MVRQQRNSVSFLWSSRRRDRSGKGSNLMVIGVAIAGMAGATQFFNLYGAPGFNSVLHKKGGLLFLCTRPGGTGWVLLHIAPGRFLDANPHRKSMSANAYKNVGSAVRCEGRKIRQKICLGLEI